MVDAGPEIETHHHHHTGHRWLDITLGVAAMVVSVVSLVVAVHHGHTMEKMVEATTWPYVDYSVSDANLAAEPRAELGMVNSGVGPARLETVEVFYHGKPMTGRDALTRAVVGDDRVVVTLKSSVSDQVLPAGQKVTFLSAIPNGSPGFAAFRAGLGGVSARVCYCSVLDVCWRRDSNQPKPEKVKTCPKPAVAYED